MIEMLPDPPGKIEYRELTPEEISSIQEIFTSRGSELPNPAHSTFVGAVQFGKVLGFLVLQVKLHAEPMWIADGHSDLFTPIVRESERTILRKIGPAWVYLFAPAGRVAQLAQSMGMGLEPWVVLSKLVQPELPSRPVTDLSDPAAEVPFDIRTLEPQGGTQ